MYKLISSKILELHSKQATRYRYRLISDSLRLGHIAGNYFPALFQSFNFRPYSLYRRRIPDDSFFLVSLGVIAAFIVVGYRYQFAVICNYIIWIIFVNFTPMQRDFDGGFDLFMIGAGFFLLFMPGDRAFSIDNLRRKLSTPFTHYSTYPSQLFQFLLITCPLLFVLAFCILIQPYIKCLPNTGATAWVLGCPQPSLIMFQPSNVALAEQ